MYAFCFLSFLHHQKVAAYTLVRFFVGSPSNMYIATSPMNLPVLQAGRGARQTGSQRGLAGQALEMMSISLQSAPQPNSPKRRGFLPLRGGAKAKSHVIDPVAQAEVSGIKGRL